MTVTISEQAKAASKEASFGHVNPGYARPTSITTLDARHFAEDLHILRQRHLNVQYKLDKLQEKQKAIGEEMDKLLYKLELETPPDLDGSADNVQRRIIGWEEVQDALDRGADARNKLIMQAPRLDPDVYRKDVRNRVPKPKEDLNDIGYTAKLTSWLSKFTFKTPKAPKRDFDAFAKEVRKLVPALEDDLGCLDRDADYTIPATNGRSRKRCKVGVPIGRVLRGAELRGNSKQLCWKHKDFTR